MSDKKLTRDLKLMIVFSSLRKISDLFLGTFLISFIMQLSANEILNISLYKLFEYVATAAGYFLFAHWCKRYSKVAVFALNVIPKAFVFGAIIYLGDNVVNYVVELGILIGLGAAMFHLPMNTMTGEKVAAPVMGRYLGIKNAVDYMVKIVAPVMLGAFITVGSYVEIAYVLLALSIVEFGLTFFLSPSRHRSRKPIDFSGFFACMMRFAILRKLFLLEILRGFSIGLLGTIIPMYTVYMFHTDLNLGIFTTIFAICSILTSLLLGKYGRQKTQPKMLWICMVVILFGLSLFVFHTTPATFLVYNFVYATAICVLNLIADTNMFNLSKSRCVTVNHKIEYFVFRDFALFIGRWIGFVSLMYIGVFGDASWLRYLLVVITASILASGAVSVKISQHIRGR